MMESLSKEIRVDIPKDDLRFFKELVKKMGWRVRTSDSILKKYIESRSDAVALSDKEILEELKAIRYGE